MVRRVMPYVSAKTLTYFYQILVLLHFGYCSMIWEAVENAYEGSYKTELLELLLATQLIF